MFEVTFDDYTLGRYDSLTATQDAIQCALNEGTHVDSIVQVDDTGEVIKQYTYECSIRVVSVN